MKIEQINADKNGFFQAVDQEKEAGRMTYVWAGEGRIIIDHTDVGPAYKGKNIGKQMLMEAVKFAREKNIKILPLCPFAKAMFDKLPEIGDVLDK